MDNKNVTSWVDLGESMWSYLTGREAAINYQFIDMEIGVPRDTSDSAPAASWKLNGTLRITTSDRELVGESA